MKNSRNILSNAVTVLITFPLQLYAADTRTTQMMRIQKAPASGPIAAQPKHAPTVRRPAAPVRQPVRTPVRSSKVIQPTAHAPIGRPTDKHKPNPSDRNFRSCIV